MSQRGLIGSTHECAACGYEVLLGPGHCLDFAVCTGCGADFQVLYSGGMFATCTGETPGVLHFNNADALKADDRDNFVEIRSGVTPLPGCDLSDLSGDACPKCESAGSLVLRLPNECECPRCHQGRMKKVGTWIQ